MIAGSCGKTIFSFYSKLPNYLPSGCTILHSQQPWMRILIAPHLCQHFVFLVLWILAIHIRYVVVFLHYIPITLLLLYLHFSDEFWRATSACMLICYLWIFLVKVSVKVLSEVAQLCLTLCDSMDCILAGSSIHGIFQARVLEWVAISFSRGSSRLRDWTRVSGIAGRHFTL